MSPTCKRCYHIVTRACQSDTESAECPNLQWQRKHILEVDYASIELRVLAHMLDEQVKS
jgi:hypothetical protein